MINLQCTHLGKKFGKTEVFRDLNFGFSGALCIGIQGANGSGKSTLMKCLSGLLRPSTGRVSWTVRDEQPDSGSIRRHIGYAAPYIHLYKELSIRENLTFIQEIRPDKRAGSENVKAAAFATGGLPDGGQEFTDLLEGKDSFSASLSGKRDTGNGIDDLIAYCGLEGLGGQEYGSLSSGQQQRVRLCGALVSRPEILMLDEPGTNLDSEGMALVREIVLHQQNSGGMVLLASNREEELSLCDRMISLSPAGAHQIRG
ncbi:ABC transporter ATP-binding protein [Natronogracilivirga saccharolytica]|uniref:ABC transporter ATP-binding protein n=1 Tax=Natronogracilivirga saccharolytica TaxID=2812953 RepID=A0A8J7UTL4_9BACT|nr:ABC transporter ATP-binding protein [Natronogracilivirga saccharolytica]MBP3191450.1 ABC transporter ATP-binding protein [Natronogracilivirga saccharolytica]